jgi:hypothetical protein
MIGLRRALVISSCWGVRSLWKEEHRHDKVIDHQGRVIEELRTRLDALERAEHGLRVSRGHAKAKSAKLQAALAESAEKLSAIKAALGDGQGDEPHPLN